MPTVEKKTVETPSGAIWTWTAADWGMFFRNGAVGAVVFILGLLLIIFTLYVAVTRGGRGIANAVPELKGALKGGK